MELDLGSQSSMRQKLIELTTDIKKETTQDIIDLNRVEWSGILKKRIEPIWNLMNSHSDQISSMMEKFEAFKDEVNQWSLKVEFKLGELTEAQDMDEKVEILEDLQKQFNDFNIQKTQNISELN
jgi:hypothetical protein